MASKLTVGHIHTDLKSGLREVISFDDVYVTYRTLAAKKTQFFDYKSNTTQSIAGTEHTCLRISFFTWSKKEMDPVEGKKYLLNLTAAKTKWTPKEKEFLTQSARRYASSELVAGFSVPIDAVPLRVARSLAEKDVLIINNASTEFVQDLQFTEFGVAAVKYHKENKN